MTESIWTHESVSRDERARSEALNLAITSLDRLAIRMSKDDNDEPTTQAIVERAEAFREFLRGEDA